MLSLVGSGPGDDAALCESMTTSRGFIERMMSSDQYIWLVWSSAFLLPWIFTYAAFPQHRNAMWWASLFTMPFGLTEPLFVPSYWNPPSLFDLAQRTGFDIESLIFCFGIGGIGSVLYNLASGRLLAPVACAERRSPHHALHRWALTTPFVVFPFLYLFPWNPIYPTIVAMALGAIATVICRLDLVQKTWIGAVLFLGYYTIFLLGMEWSAPGYIERVWNIRALLGVTLVGMPVEELMFAGAFGAYWSSVYDHFTWKVLAPREGRINS